MSANQTALLVLLLSALGVLVVSAGEQRPSASSTARAATAAATAAGPATGGRDEDVLHLLTDHHLVVPVKGTPRSALRDNFDERRGGRRHEALDILAPRGTPVIATGDGRVAKLFKSGAGGFTIYQFDPEERFAYYYAHLDAYAPGIVEGAAVKRGEILGYVGTTGNAPPGTPHLHFTIFQLGPEKRWWKGKAVNPLPFLNDG